VSFTPEKFGQDAASSTIRSESRSMPALAPGSVCACIHQQMDRFGRIHKHPTIVNQDGHWAFTRNLREILLQCGPVIRKYPGEVSGRNDDSGVCPCNSDFLTKRNSLPRATATSTYDDRDVQETRRVECFTSGMDQPRALAMRKVYALPHRACQKWAHSSTSQVCHMFLQSLQIYLPQRRQYGETYVQCRDEPRSSLSGRKKVGRGA
jgi:hypothetical protein